MGIVERPDVQGRREGGDWCTRRSQGALEELCFKARVGTDVKEAHGAQHIMKGSPVSCSSAYSVA